MSASISIVIEGNGQIRVSVQPAELMADKIVMFGVLESVKDVVRDYIKNSSQVTDSGIVKVSAMPSVLKL